MERGSNPTPIVPKVLFMIKLRRFKNPPLRGRILYEKFYKKLTK
jgi:hypothetical protein